MTQPHGRMGHSLLAVQGVVFGDLARSGVANFGSHHSSADKFLDLWGACGPDAMLYEPYLARRLEAEHPFPNLKLVYQSK